MSKNVRVKECKIDLKGGWCPFRDEEGQCEVAYVPEKPDPRDWPDMSYHREIKCSSSEPAPKECPLRTQKIVVEKQT